MEVWVQVPNERIIITSGNDSTLVANSFHHVNQAIDLRANNKTVAQATQIEQLWQDALSSEFRVAFEQFPGNESNNHFYLASRG